MQSRSDFDDVFIPTGNRSGNVTEADMNGIENFILKTYTKLSEISLINFGINMFKSLTVNDLRLRKLSPSRRALEQLTREACYQAGYVWQELDSDLAPSILEK